jgi:hypothetical protein
MLAGLLLRTPTCVRFAQWLPHATRRTLSAADLARIDAYTGDGQALHEMLPAVLPLAAPVWYEAQITAQHGTRMVLGYGATPAAPGEIDVWFAAGTAGRVALALGPMRMDSQSTALGEGDDRELRVACGIVVRALLMRAGTEA